MRGKVQFNNSLTDQFYLTQALKLDFKYSSNAFCDLILTRYVRWHRVEERVHHLNFKVVKSLIMKSNNLNWTISIQWLSIGSECVQKNVTFLTITHSHSLNVISLVAKTLTQKLLVVQTFIVEMVSTWPQDEN